jgi:hypothetical protein
MLSSGELSVTSAMTIKGAGPGGAGGTTIEQTDGVSRVISATATTGTVALSALEVTGGHLAAGTGTNAPGGGIYSPATLNLDQVRVTGNFVQGGSGSPNAGAAQGGGIDFPSGALAGSMITNSTIDGNVVQGGAGGPSGKGGYAEGGGVVWEGTGALVVRDTTISGNSTTAGAGQPGGNAYGGGIFGDSDVVVDGSTIAGDTATGAREFADGGGLYELEATATVINSTVFGNLAQGSTGANGGTGRAGGIGADGSTAGLQLASDTVDANRASTDAGDLEAYVGNPPAPYTFTIRDTIVAGGSAPSNGNCDLHASTNPPTSESYNLEDDSAGECDFSVVNHDLVDNNPLLPSALAANGGPTQTLAPAYNPGYPRADSPVIGAGGECRDPISTPPNQPLTVDQRGEPRHSPCDIGAFEHQPPPPLPYVTVSHVSGKDGHASMRLTCHGVPGQTCSGRVRLGTVELLKGKHIIRLVFASARRRHRRSVTDGRRPYRLAAGQSIVMRIAPNATGRRLLGQFGKLPALVFATPQPTGPVNEPIPKVTIRPRRRGHH